MLIKRLGLVLPLFLVVFGMSSCVNGNRSIGSQLLGSDIAVSSIDSFTVDLSSYLLDSVITNNKNLALVGEYDSPIFGQTKASSYIVFGRPNIYQLDQNSVYDSLVMTLYCSGYYYGDTLVPYTINLHRVNQDIVFPENDLPFLYNTSFFTYDLTTIGDTTILIKPKSKSKVTINMSNVLGNELFDKFMIHSEQFSDQADFIDYFKGIALIGSDTLTSGSDNSVVGFDLSDTSIHMNLYYHIQGDVINVAKSIAFFPYDATRQFNHMYSVRTGTLIDKLSENPISSSETGNYAYVQGGTGIVTRVDFPTLRDINLNYKHLQVLRAELIVEPVGENGDTQFFPKRLNLYYTNKHNDLLSIVKDSQGNIQGGSLYTDQVVPDNSTYTWDITTYVNTVLGDNLNQLSGLIIMPENVASTFDRVTLADQFRSHYRTKLKLYIASYE